MSRLCTDWPRTLDQRRAKAYIALVLAPCSPRLTMFVRSSSAAPSLYLQLIASASHRITHVRLLCRIRPPRIPLACGLWSLPCRVMVSRQQGWRCCLLQLCEALSTPRRQGYPLLSPGTSSAASLMSAQALECRGLRPAPRSTETALTTRSRNLGAEAAAERLFGAHMSAHVWQPRVSPPPPSRLSLRLTISAWRVGSTGSSSFRSACATGRNPSDHAMGPGCLVPWYWRAAPLVHQLTYIS